MSTGEHSAASREPHIAFKAFHIVLAIASAILIIALVATDGFGMTQPQPKKCLDDYEWAELQPIAQQIKDAPNDEEAIRIAAKFNLCAPDGTIDPNNIKKVKLTNGVETGVRIIGFRHDVRSDGSLTAITFCFTEPLLDYAFEKKPGTGRGWMTSSIREYMSETKFKQSIPIDLRAGVKSVNKSCNVAKADGEKPRTKDLEDSFWLISAVEYLGQQEGLYPDEGKQYQLFAQGKVALWADGDVWTRSSNIENTSESWVATPDATIAAKLQSDKFGLVPAFCY